MAPPSSVQSAVAIAAAAKARYDATFGMTRPPLPPNIDEQAEFFFRRGELATVYLRTYVDPNAFAKPPNEGHYAAADLLLVQGIQTAATTNVDTLIEMAGQYLFGHVGVGIDQRIATLPADIAPLLKLHGCRLCDPDNAVWARGQLAVDPVAARIAFSQNWLPVRLLDRDLIIVGYWTDWDYLNEVLTATLGAVRPSRVIVVDPCDDAAFERKAPDLYALGHRASNGFQHVRASGADFLAALRREFSRAFVRRALHTGAAQFEAVTGAPANPIWLEPPILDNRDLWQTRRDLEGRAPGEPAKNRDPPAEPLVGLTVLQLRARGATPDGTYWVLGGRKVRVLRAPNIMLHQVEAAFARDVAPVVAPDIVVAVGSESYSLPASITRAGTPATIARGTSSVWMTRPDAVAGLGL